MTNEDLTIFMVLAFVWVEFVWELYLALRQLRVYRTAGTVPDELKGIFNSNTFQKARTYSVDKLVFSTVEDFFCLIISTLFVSIKGLFLFWNGAEMLVNLMGFEPDELIVASVFKFLLSVFDTLTSLPFDVYNTFVIEEKHGFNNQTAGFFIRDRLKVFISSQFLALLMSSVRLHLVKVGGDHSLVYFGLFASVAVCLLAMLYPDFIAPMFDDFTPLPEGVLKDRIEQLASRLDFPLQRVFIVEGSKRSAHSNAYLYGFYKNKTIVLYDTLLESHSAPGQVKRGCNDDEVLAILGHELGHWKLGHVLKTFAVEICALLLILISFWNLTKQTSLYRAFGFTDQFPAVVGQIIVLHYVLPPVLTLLGVGFIWLSRRFELQADAFTATLGLSSHLRPALVKLHRDNLDFPEDDWLFSAYHNSHPPLLQRLRALEKLD